MDKKIVIVGAGYAGILTAKKLAKRFKKSQGVSITIIDKNPFHTMLTELHEVAAGRVDEDSIKIELKKVFAGRRVDVKHDLITSIDYEKKLVSGKKESYDYDILVLAAGSKPHFYGVPGAEEHSFKLWSYEDAVRLREHISNCFRKASASIDMDEKKRLLSFCVIGAGFTGVEMVGELAEYVPILCEKFGIERKLVTLCNVDMLPRAIPNLPEKLSRKVERRLEKMGVELMLGTSVVEIGSDYIEIKKNDNTMRHSVGTVIWAAGIQSADITQEAAGKLESTNSGRIVVDEYLRAKDNTDVFVVGDNMMYTPKGESAPVPQMVENCEHSADTASHNIVYAAVGKGNMEEYKPTFHGVMVSVGGRYGVARVGTPGRMYNLPSFLAMFTKHFINVVYFIQVLGWNKAFGYLKHEIFTIRNCRSFVGGHFSNRTPSFLLVPLRVWLGAVWLFEGIMKVIEGWLGAPKLTDFFGSANSWYNGIINGTVDGASAATGAAQVAADAVTAATGASESVASGTGTLIFNIDIIGLVNAVFVSGKELAHSMLNDYAFKLDIPLMNRFIERFILANDSAQIAMQAFIVIAEILIGLALIGGLFTFPASALSLILQFMFITTTGLYLSTFWMIFAGIAVLINAGKTIGLDYYASPYLKTLWKKLPFVRKMYIYND